MSVVIPTYQRRASVERALRALARQTLPVDEYEVILSIDGSDDGTREMATQLAAPYRLHVLWQPNRGRSAACNAGIGAASGWLLVLIDDDMEPWQSGESTTAVFWCLRTMETAGPDDAYCHPSTCQSGRACCAPARHQAAAA